MQSETIIIITMKSLKNLLFVITVLLFSQCSDDQYSFVVLNAY